MNHAELVASVPIRFASRQRRRMKSFVRHLMPLRRRIAGETGSSLIEFTVSVPILFMLMIGFVQMSVGVYSNFCVTAIARDMARWASVRGSNSCADAPGMTDCDATSAEVQAAAQRTEYPGIDPSKLTVSTSWLQASSTAPASWSNCTSSSGCNAPGNAVRVMVAYPFPYQIPFLASKELDLSSTAQLVIVQ